MSDGQGTSSGSSRAASSSSGSVWRIISTPAPPWLGAEIGPLIVALGLVGLVAFGLTGFSGDRNSPGLLLTPFFVKPIVLFWWFCALVVTLQLEVLRHPSPNADAASVRKQIVGLAASIASIIIWTVLTFAGHRANEVVSGVPGSSGRHIDQIVAILLNLWFVGVFWVDTAHRWIRWRHGKRRSRTVTTPNDSSAQSGRSAWQRAGTDLMAAALLAIALTVVFSASVVNFLAQVTQITINRNPHVDPCTVSVIANCDPRQSLPPLQTLSGLDRLQAIVYFALGTIVLGTFLLRIGIAGGLPKTLDELMRILREAPRRVFVALLRPLRHVLWPVCAFVAIYCETVTALDVQTYLHHLSEQHQAGSAFDLDPQNYSLLGHAVLFGVLAPLLIIVAVVIMLYPWDTPTDAGQAWAGDVWKNWIKALVQIGLSVMAAFLLFSLALFAINGGIAFFVPAPVPQPFVPPGVSTYAVALALVILFIAISWQSRRKRRQRAAVRVTARESNRGA